MTRKQIRKTTFTATRSLAALAGVVGFSLATVTLAAPRGQDFPISLAEAQDRAEARFQELDADGSGELSPEEFAAGARGGHLGFPRMMHGEADRKPRKGLQRHGAAPESVQAETFARLDTDGDGMLSREEFDARKLHESNRAVMQERLFARLDKDGSGGLSRDELPDPSKRLAAMDADGDGLVTRAEADAHVQALRERRKEAREARPERRSNRSSDNG